MLLIKFSSGTVISIRATPSLAFAAPITFRLRSRDTVLRKSADPSLLLHALLDLSELICSFSLPSPTYHHVQSLIELYKLSANTMSRSTSLNVIFTIEPTAGSKYQSPREKFISPRFPGSRQGKGKSGVFPRLLPRNSFYPVAGDIFLLPLMPGFAQDFFPVV